MIDKQGRRRLIGIITVTMLAVAAGLLALMQQNNSAVDPGSVGLSSVEQSTLNVGNQSAANGVLRWREGQAQQYDIEFNSSFHMSMPGGANPQSIRVYIGAIMDFRTLEVSPTEVLVGVKLPEINLHINGVNQLAMNNVLTEPFRVRYTHAGLPVTFEFLPSVSGDLRGVIENLLRNFQVSMKGGDSWQARELNATGEYQAEYVQISPLLFEKTKQKYLKLGSNSPPNLYSAESIVLNDQHDWISSMTVEETTEATDPSGPLVKGTSRAVLQVRSLIKGNIASVDLWSFTEGAAEEPAPTLALSEARKQMLAGVNQLNVSTKRRNVQISRLRELMDMYDSLADELLEFMKTQALSDRTRADLFFVFQSSGSPAAQTALTTAFQWSEQDALRAIVAMGGVEAPIDEALTALWNTAHSGQDTSLPDTAVLALGRLGDGMQASQANDYSSLRGSLLDGAYSASDDFSRSVYIMALGSTSDQSLQDDLVPFLNDQDPGIRSATVASLGRLGVNNIAGHLVHQFDNDENSKVRGSIAKALILWDKPTAAVSASFRRAVQQERDETARYNMIKFLGRNLAQSPENKASLKDLMRNEQSKRIRILITESLTNENVK